MEQYLLSDLVSSDILQELQDAFSRYSGMAALITDANGTPLTTGSGFTRFCMELTRKSELGCKNCEACDRQGAIMTLQSGKPVVYSCHAGLTDYAAPIMVNDEFIGSFIGGQVRTEPVNEIIMRETAIRYNIDPDDYIAAAKATNELDRKSIENAARFLSEIAAVLSKIALEKYQTLKQKQLVENSAKTQSDYLRRFSGDLKQNLNDLAEFIGKISDPEPDEDETVTLAYAAVLASNTMSLGSMLDETIDFMQIEGGNYELKEAVYDIRQMVELKVNEYKIKTKNTAIEMTFQVEDNVPPHLMGDSGRVNSIIGKLLENSLKHSKSGKIHTNISCTSQGYATILEIRISDEGEGIDEESRQRILEYMMTRGVSTRTNQHFDEEGFAIIGYAINAMHGKVTLTSELDAGTTFTITLPQLAVDN